jgi:hypothetical protein
MLKEIDPRIAEANAMVRAYCAEMKICAECGKRRRPLEDAL